MTPVIVLTTAGTSFDAEGMAAVLVEKRLAACVNIVPRIRSVYRWHGKVEHDDEQLLVIKTTEERVAELRDEVLARHPYEVPELVILRMDSIEGPYRQWLLDAVAR